MKREVVVEQVTVHQDGVQLSFMVLPDDVRSGGKLVSSRSLFVNNRAPGEMGAMAVDLRTAMEDLVEAVLMNWDNLDIHDPAAAEALMLDDEDEDIGMGQGR